MLHRPVTTIRRFALPALTAATLLLGFTAAGTAQEWPARTVTITQTFAPGGMMDFASRAIAQELTEKLGQNFIVETKAGGSGIVGVLAAAKAAPDGYNFVVSAIGPMVFRPAVDKAVGFDADKDFQPVIMIGATPNGILAAPKLGVSTVAELKAWATKNGNTINIGMPGYNTMGQYCGVLLLEKLGIQGNFVNYRGATPIIHDLAGGQIELGTPAFNAGAAAVKILAISSDQRLEAFPDVPTLKESGLEITCATWNALFAPAGTPKEIVAKMNAVINAFFKKPETRKAFNDIGMAPWGGPPERVTQQMAEDRKTWGDLVRRLEASNPKQ